MTLHPLSPAQALWQHYVATSRPPTATLRTNPVYHKDIYARLQQLGRKIADATPAASTRSAMKPAASRWQPVAHRDGMHEGLGLSEL